MTPTAIVKNIKFLINKFILPKYDFLGEYGINLSDDSLLISFFLTYELRNPNILKTVDNDIKELVRRLIKHVAPEYENKILKKYRFDIKYNYGDSQWFVANIAKELGEFNKETKKITWYK